MTSDRTLVAAVDLGSTSTKVCLYDADGRCAAAASRPTERFNPFAAQHPEERQQQDRTLEDHP